MRFSLKIAAAILCLLSVPAFAQVGPGGGACQYYSGIWTLTNYQSIPCQADVNGNLKVTIQNSTTSPANVNVQQWDGTALGAPSNYGTSPGAVTVPGVNAYVTNNPNVGGFDSGPIQASETPANSSHAAGTSVGGLFTLGVARTNGGSGIITNYAFKSSGGSTGSYVIRIWDKNPSNTTCTDNSAFSGSATDDANLIVPPFTITPAAPASTTGDSNTYAAVTQVSWDYKNADGTASQNVYACAVTVATDTADENKAVYMTVSGPQN